MRLWWLSLPLLASAFHNITYVSNDPALVYTPTNTWQNWPPNGCLNFPIGQWSKVPGTITLKFSGVAVFAYGLFDDDTNPIYTIQVDDESPVRLGDYTSTNCELFSKTGLRAGNHTIIFRLTGERPGDVKDLSFQGFIVTVPDVGDDVTQTSNNTPSRKSNTAIIAAAVAIGVAALVGVIIGIYFWRSRRNRAQKGQPIGVPPPSSFSNQPPVTTQYNNGFDPSIPQPTPFFVPPRETRHTITQRLHGRLRCLERVPRIPTLHTINQDKPGYPNYYGPSPSNAGSSSGYGAPNSPPPFQQGGTQGGYNYQPPPPVSPAPTSSYMPAASEVSYTQMSDVTQSSGGYKPPIDTKATPFAKGAVNPNAAPVHRVDGPSGSNPQAPPQYDAPF
ncbi:hypothetical protein PIIN_02777 [Serendipita indica DSM 11827]|uniref:Uncharacterized protein n=1 Tax=Serendipita indica (strain DSM 11827) TaxID=1109443 RepID=G4TC74_SERID|nr:hypothetical protein PIIN_02777 [Serendipita indica DSM 11827]